MSNENSTHSTKITAPDHPAMDELTAKLRAPADKLELAGIEAWPAEQLQWCGEHGVYEWFLGSAVGGQQWSDADLVEGYLRLSSACLTTTFIITQRTGACRRIANGESDFCRDHWLPGLLTLSLIHI